MMFTCTHDAGLWALANPQEMQLPLLIFHGTADRLTSYKASQEFSGRVKGDVTFKTFESAYHETHNDLCRDEVLAMLKEWLAKRF
jgi:alpha-beta hydrolase superfamily lysophospholipase